ncbi:hypothetical protein [Halomonas huangheensis]|uniref:Adhesin n=1 Tax=Halomonas huangheensis TaxID=1178482 RepID=W1N3P5_9GAMM|nr:hypothetical protein [Halomonas huangheensis]ALM51632.1 hypothetical protein AR456_04520 [Halomonas huangheensis]ERL50114.1 hypothetical protein BJB45_03035 [Halomonas huangheensis]
MKRHPWQHGQRESAVRHWLEGAILMTALAVVMASPESAHSQDLSALKSSTVIGGNALSNVSGVAAANTAAGQGNLQSNSGNLAIGQQAGTNQGLVQQSRIDQRLAAIQADTAIKERAFRNASGWVSVNQAAGIGNVQSNTFGMAMGTGVSDLSDNSLQQVLATGQGLNGSAGGNAGSTVRNLEIDESAFSGARGVIQVSQSAGTGNATSNRFSLRLNQ